MIVPTIMKECNLSKFKFYSKNRAVKKAHIDELCLAITRDNRLHLHPIIVKQEDDGLYVVDGQHRLKACEKLNLPVFYIISESDHDMAMIDDQISVKWRVEDYLHFHITEGHQAYIDLDNLLKETKFTINQFVGLMHRSTHSFYGPFRKGDLVIPEVTKNFMEACAPYFSHALRLYKDLTLRMVVNRQDFIRALFWFYKRYEKTEFASLMEAFTSFCLDLPHKATQDTYERILVRAYNKNRPQGKKKIIHPLDVKYREE